MLDKWATEKAEKQTKALNLEEGEAPPAEPLRMTQAQAAYQVMLCEQNDLVGSLRLQGYTDDVVQQLKDFAGAEMMAVAYG